MTYEGSWQLPKYLYNGLCWIDNERKSLKLYRITKIEKNQKEVTVELTEAQFLLLQSLVQDGEDFYSSEDSESMTVLDEPVQDVFAEVYSKVEEVL